ncbi:MAG: Gfo/Idh/MocA family protein [Bryobacteraceae bacterium]
MRSPVRIGIAGCGDITLRGVLPHLSEPDARERMEVTAVCDVDAPRARATAERFGVPRWFASCEQMLGDPRIDLVCILTPTACHAEQAIAALERGKHVYLQKPMAGTLPDAQRVLAAAGKCGRTLLAAPAQRLCPLIDALGLTVRQGALGTVFWCVTATHFPTTCEGSGFDRTWHYGPLGGPVRDRTLYSLATLTTLFGPARKVTAMANLRIPVRHLSANDGAPGPRQVETEDNAVLLLEFDQGILAVASGNYCAEGQAIPAGFIGVYGSNGSIETSEVDPATWYPTRLEMRAGGKLALMEGPLETIPGLAGAHAHLPEAQVYADIFHLVECLLEDKQPVSHPRQACHLVEVVEKAYEASRTGRTQSLHTTF